MDRHRAPAHRHLCSRPPLSTYHRGVEYETIVVERRADGVAILTLNRPERLHAFNRLMMDEVAAAWVALRDDAGVRAVVLTASGSKAFCVGIDRLDDVPQDEAAYSFDPFTWVDPGQKLSPKHHGLWKPVIAAVNGMACGGAFYLLGEVEFIVAADHATFFDPHLSFGMAAILEPTLMANRMPFGEIMRLSLMGSHERVSARRAHEIGLVSEVVPGEALLERALWCAQVIAEAPTEASQATVRNLWLAREPARRAALEMSSFLLHAGNNAANMAAGQAKFSAGTRIEPRIR